MITGIRIIFLSTSMVLAVVASGCGKTPVASLDNVPDLQVTEHVKLALQQDELLKGFDIQVSTIKGDVKLNGVVDTQAQIDEAIKLARAADGVHAIHDELTVKR
jgi:hyperosmotically inducible protein